VPAEPLPARADTLAADPAARGAVDAVTQAFAKALRAQHLYDRASPMFARFVGTLRDRFRALWDVLPSLTLSVEEDRMLWAGEVVYRAESRTDPLVHAFHKDGVRELTFFPGFAVEELDYLLEIVGRAHRLRAEEDDLLTLLWQRDWNCFLYQYIDVPGEGMPLPESRVAAPAPVAPPRGEASADAPAVRGQDLSDNPYFLEESELRRLAGEVRQEMERDLWRDVLYALLDRMEDGVPERQVVIAGIVQEVLPSLLAAGNLQHAALLLREMQTLVANAERLDVSVREQIETIFERLSAPAAIDELIRTLDDSPSADDVAALHGLLRQYPPAALGPLVRAAETIPVPSLREAIGGVVLELAATAGPFMARLLESPDPVIAAGVAKLAGRTADTTFILPLTRLLGHPEAAARIAAVDALQALGSPGYNGAVQDRLGDADREVRLAAARAIAALRYGPAKSRLLELIGSGRLKERDVTERIAHFEAFGAAAGAAGVADLERLLTGRSWLGRREAPEVRACAALGLARTQAPDALRVLREAASEPDAVVRSAVTRALRAFES
jgi:HEAT repeat protein